MKPKQERFSEPTNRTQATCPVCCGVLEARTLPQPGELIHGAGDKCVARLVKREALEQPARERLALELNK